MSIKQGVQQRL